MARRFAVLSFLALFITIALFFNPFAGTPSIPNLSPISHSSPSSANSVSPDLLDGKAIAPKLGNETIK